MAYIVEHQYSLFDDPEEPSYDISEPEIQKCINRGSGMEHGKLRIYRHFQKDLGKSSNVEFLKHEYGIGGCWPAYGADREKEVAIDYNSSGIKISRIVHLETSVFIRWEKVETMIREMIKNGTYVDKSDPCYDCIFEVDGYCKHQSGDDWYCVPWREGKSFRIPKNEKKE